MSDRFCAFIGSRNALINCSQFDIFYGPLLCNAHGPAASHNPFVTLPLCGFSHLLDFYNKGWTGGKHANLIYLPGIRRAVQEGVEKIAAFLIHNGVWKPLPLNLEGPLPDYRAILRSGCLINYYAQ
jgi:hypothetical protein